MPSHSHCKLTTVQWLSWESQKKQQAQFAVKLNAVIANDSGYLVIFSGYFLVVLIRLRFPLISYIVTIFNLLHFSLGVSLSEFFSIRGVLK